MITGSEFVNKAREHIGMAYKWGGDFDGEFDRVTVDNVNAWAVLDPIHFGYQKQQWLKTLFLGKLAGDCSGLMTHCLGLPKIHSDVLFNMCDEKIKFDMNKPLNEQIPQVAGLIMWRAGHIGVFCGDGYVVESGSTRYGVKATFITEPITGSSWTHYGYLRRYIDYNATPKAEPVIDGIDMVKVPSAEVQTWTCSRVLKLLSPNMRGTEVKNLQKALNENGFDCGSADGVFGNKTNQAVKDFQKANGLEVDGKAGRITIAKLGGTWKN